MPALQAEKFSTYLLTSERELAKEVTTSLFTKGSIVINIFFIAQLLGLSGKVTQSHLIASLVLLGSLGLSIRLMTKLKNNSPIMINQAALMMLPIYIENSVTKPWVSYGLLCAILIIIAAGIDSKEIFFATLVTAPLLQYFVANLDLQGVIDNNDLLLLNSYFSSLWILIAGIGVRIARASYYKYCDQIDEELFTLQDRLIEESVSQSQINLKDYKNISLHGTVLNTLISYKNTLNLDEKRIQLATDISQDIEKIESAQQSATTNTPFIRILESNLKQYGIKLILKVDPTLILSSDIVESTLEIIREIVLNTKKHTDSQVIEITLIDDINKLKINVCEIINKVLLYAEMDSKLAAVNSSKTLTRLTNSSKVNIKISGNAAKQRVFYDIEVLKSSRPQDVLKKIETLREASLLRNVQLLSLVSVFYSYLAIIGFLFVSVPLYVIFALTISALLLTYELLGSRKSYWRSIVSQVLLMTLIPYVIFTNETCQNLLYTPWLFNAMVGSVLYGVAVLKNPLFKWFPALIFIAENTRTRWVFPEECKTLLDGSTPGFVFILVFGFLMARLRQRNTALDKSLEDSLRSQIEQAKDISLLINSKRNSIIEELKLFAKNLQVSSISQEQLRIKIGLLTQKIRVFLICSEHFSSTLIQSLFQFAITRIEGGSPIKISIYTNQISDHYAFDFSLLNELNLQSQGKDVEIVITDNERLELVYLVDGEVVATFVLTN